MKLLVNDHYYVGGGGGGVRQLYTTAYELLFLLDFVDALNHRG